MSPGECKSLHFLVLFSAENSCFVTESRFYAITSTQDDEISSERSFKNEVIEAKVTRNWKKRMNFLEVDFTLSYLTLIVVLMESVI